MLGNAELCIYVSVCGITKSISYWWVPHSCQHALNQRPNYTAVPFSAFSKWYNVGKTKKQITEKIIMCQRLHKPSFQTVLQVHVLMNWIRQHRNSWCKAESASQTSLKRTEVNRHVREVKGISVADQARDQPGSLVLLPHQEQTIITAHLSAWITIMWRVIELVHHQLIMNSSKEGT